MVNFENINNTIPDNYQLRVLIEDSPNLTIGNGYEDDFVRLIRDKQNNYFIVSPHPLSALDKAVVKVILKLEELEENEVNLDNLYVVDLVPDMGMDIDFLMKIYLRLP